MAAYYDSDFSWEEYAAEKGTPGDLNDLHDIVQALIWLPMGL
jgi:hypothetical protein